MSQVNSNIRSALVVAYNDAALGLPTALPNTAFDKPGDAPWAELFFLFGTVSPQTLGSQGEDYHSGILQIDLNYPPLLGEGPVLAVVDQIQTHFKAGYRATYGGQEVVFRSVSRTSGRLDRGWWKVNVSVAWYAFAPRS